MSIDSFHNYPSNPYGVAITPDSKYVYITLYESESVRVISTATNQQLASSNFFDHPRGVAITPDGKLVYVAFELDSVLVLSRTLSRGKSNTHSNTDSNSNTRLAIPVCS